MEVVELEQALEALVWGLEALPSPPASPPLALPDPSPPSANFPIELFNAQSLLSQYEQRRRWSLMDRAAFSCGVRPTPAGPVPPKGAGFSSLLGNVDYGGLTDSEVKKLGRVVAELPFLGPVPSPSQPSASIHRSRTARAYSISHRLGPGLPDDPPLCTEPRPSLRSPPDYGPPPSTYEPIVGANVSIGDDFDEMDVTEAPARPGWRPDAVVPAASPPPKPLTMPPIRASSPSIPALATGEKLRAEIGPRGALPTPPDRALPSQPVDPPDASSPPCKVSNLSHSASKAFSLDDLLSKIPGSAKGSSAAGRNGGPSAVPSRSEPEPNPFEESHMTLDKHKLLLKKLATGSLSREEEGEILEEQRRYLHWAFRSSEAFKYPLLFISKDILSIVDGILRRKKEAQIGWYGAELYGRAESLAVCPPASSLTAELIHSSIVLKVGRVYAMTPLTENSEVSTSRNFYPSAIQLANADPSMELYSKKMHPPVSRDAYVGHCLSKSAKEGHFIDVVMSSSAFTALFGLDFENSAQWQLPIAIREFSLPTPEGGTSVRKVVFIDKPIVRAKYSPRQINEIFFKMALHHLAITSGEKQSVLSEFATPMTETPLSGVDWIAPTEFSALLAYDRWKLGDDLTLLIRTTQYGQLPSGQQGYFNTKQVLVPGEGISHRERAAFVASSIIRPHCQANIAFIDPVQKRLKQWSSVPVDAKWSDGNIAAPTQLARVRHILLQLKLLEAGVYLLERTSPLSNVLSLSARMPENQAGGVDMAKAWAAGGVIDAANHDFCPPEWIPRYNRLPFTFPPVTWEERTGNLRHCYKFALASQDPTKPMCNNPECQFAHLTFEEVELHKGTLPGLGRKRKRRYARKDKDAALSKKQKTSVDSAPREENGQASDSVT